MSVTTIETGHNILNVFKGATNTSVELQLGDVLTSFAEINGASLIQQPGFCSMPSNAIAGQSASEAIVIRAPDRDIVIGSRDVRSQDMYGNLDPGEVAIYAAGSDGTGQARVMCKGDGSINMITTDDNTASGNNVQFSISPTALSFVAPWGSLTFDTTGLRFSTTSGATFTLNGNADPTTGNSCMISAGTTTINSGMVFLGSTASAAPFSALYGVLPVAAPAIPILGEGVGEVLVNAAGSTSVFIGI